MNMLEGYPVADWSHPLYPDIGEALYRDGDAFFIRIRRARYSEDIPLGGMGQVTEWLHRRGFSDVAIADIFGDSVVIE